MSADGGIGLVESRAGAPTLGSGGDSGAFAPGLSPAPIVTFPAPALRTRRADFRHRALQWDHASRTRTAVAIRAFSGSDSPTSAAAAARLPLCIPSRVRRAVEPVHASTTSSLYGSTPSLMHVMFPESLPLTRGLRQRHSRRPSSFQHPSTPEAPFLDRNYPASSVVRASPPPWRPGLPLTGFRLTRAHHRQGFPCCVLFPLPCMPAPIPGGSGRCLYRSLPGRHRSSPFPRRVDSRIARFEACSAFIHIPACMFAEPPIAVLLSECFNPCRYLHESP